MRSWPRAPPPTIVAFSSGHCAKPYHVPGMQHHESLAGRGEVEERLAVLGRVEELAIDADDRDVGCADLGRGLVAIFRVVDAESGGLERRAVRARRRHLPKLCELPPPMISTFVLPAAQTIGFVSGSGPSPRPPSFGPVTGAVACAGAAACADCGRSLPAAARCRHRPERPAQDRCPR